MDELRVVDAMGAGWLAGILVLAFGIVAWVNMVSPRQWAVIGRSFAAFRLGHHRLREDFDVRDRALTGLMVLATMVIALFAYQALVFHGWVRPGPAEFGRVLLLVAVATAAQLVLLRAIAMLPEADGGLEEYLYTVIIFHVALGLLLLPVTILMSFPAQVAWREGAWLAGVGMAAATVLFRWGRAVVIGLGNGTPLRYIFIYICALEILPVGLVIERAWHFVPPSPNL